MSGSAKETDATDRALVARIAAGDQGAIQALFARHYTRVFRFVMRQVRSESMAEEIANDVFLDAWRQAGRFEGRSRVATWLLAIAYNKAVSALRKRREEQLDEGFAESIADEGDAPETSALKSDKAEALRAAIERLSPEHRAVIDLVYYHEQSVAEVSAVLGIPANTVKTRMFHARKRLAQYLAEAGIDRGWP